MIKPEFYSSTTLSNLSLEANYLFPGLWVHADDYGVYPLNYRKILGDIFPYRASVTEAQVKKWLSELLGVGVIIKAEVENTEFLVITHWAEHQTVPNPSKRRYLEDETINKIKELWSTDNTDHRDYLESNEDQIRVYLDSNSLKRKNKEKEKEKGSTDNSSRKKHKQKKFTPPTYEEFEKYCAQYQYKNISRKAWEYYSVADWHDSRGNPVLNWKQKLIQNWFKKEQKDPPPKKKWVTYDPPLPEGCPSDW